MADRLFTAADWRAGRLPSWIRRARVEGCVCGGSIRVADPNDPDAVATAVSRHNATPGHTAWRLGLTLERDSLTDTPDGLGVRRMT